MRADVPVGAYLSSSSIPRPPRRWRRASGGDAAHLLAGVESQELDDGPKNRRSHHASTSRGQRIRADRPGLLPGRAGGQGHRGRRPSTTSPTPRRSPISSSTTPCTATCTRRSSPRATPSSSTAGRSACARSRTPRRLPWRRAGRGHRGRVDRASSATRPRRRSTCRRARRRSIITAPAKDPDITVVLGVNEQTVRSRQARAGLERLLHDELPRDRRQGAARQLRDQARLRLHRALATPTTSPSTTSPTRTSGGRGPAPSA